MGGKITKFLKSIKAWQLILVLIPMLFIAATLLRFDDLKMIELRDAVYAADESGTDEEIAQALKNLKDFASTHIIVNFEEKNGQYNLNFGTGPIWLENQYNRKATAAIEEAEKELAKQSHSNPNGNVFAAAMAVCKPQAIKYGWAWNSSNYLDCMTGEINKYPTTDYLVNSYTASIPSTALFRYDFASPAWAPTLAGWVILLCLVLIIWIITKFVTWVIVRVAMIFIK
ncbi:hypothetical protein IJH97_00430 [Candidatus Saccharibacteria bacterium]|nr:hypothetical protein [Candidatus Saccharibacteria bacterium]